MTYPEALRYLNSLTNYEQKSNYPYLDSFELERVEGFLRLLGEPQKGLKCLHIAGSKGKGSTCVFAAYILRQAGFRVGLYTSPHLIDFRERIRVLKPIADSGLGHRRPNHGLLASRTRGADFEGMISKRELTDLVNRLKPYIEEYNRNLKKDSLTFFEAYTALAFLYFKEKKVDFAVLETGLGGRLDATNTVNSLVCAVTPISYEHTDKLGNTLRKIAAEKAGIIKNRKTVVITAPQKKEAFAVIREKCRQAKARLFEVGKDIVCQKNKNGFSIKGIFGRYDNLKIRLLGEHQLINALTAVGVIEALRFFGVKINSGSIRKGLNEAVWPGRCEVVLKKPLVILDGAQNSASVKALKETINDNFKYKKLILILGISSDKDIPGICRQLNGWADQVIFTKANSSRAESPQALIRYFKTDKPSLTAGVREALHLALKIAEAKDLLLVTGSLFVVGEARDFFSGNSR
ncbi:MAG: folylpolyglutamate synthase/dihydrofolate synthase family protein [Candidatus Omnitrophota bacterium]|nr:folylpolyglutamate synthase/dihydrofolate synthase family protein [Candidatus Omnitrophota bacterium]